MLKSDYVSIEMFVNLKHEYLIAVGVVGAYAGDKGVRAYVSERFIHSVILLSECTFKLWHGAK